MTVSHFRNRAEAGRLLAERLKSRQLEAPIVLALPRGGVPVADEIAEALRAPLDLIIVRKVGLPYQPELAIAAVIDGDHPQIVVNDDVAAAAGIARDQIEHLAKPEIQELERRREAYMRGRPPLDLRDRDVVVVDDGIATGASIRAAILGMRRRSPRRLILAVPIAAKDTIGELRNLVDDVVCLATPDPLYAIGHHYEDFHQMTDEEVLEILCKAERRSPDAPPKPTP